MNSDIRAQHDAMVRALTKPGAEILATLTPEKCNLMHIAFGILGEAAELQLSETHSNTVEEAGDLQFFLRAGMAAIGHTDPEALELDAGITGEETGTSRVTAAAARGKLLRHAEQAFDIIKKHVIYSKTLDVALLHEHFIECAIALNATLRAWPIIEQANWHKCLQANIEKLSKRYPNFQYTDQRAQERADKVEA